MIVGRNVENRTRPGSEQPLMAITRKEIGVHHTEVGEVDVAYSMGAIY